MANLSYTRSDASRRADRSHSGVHAAATTRADGPPRTDAGTVILHWVTAVAMVVSLLTGLRIAADAIDAVVSRAMTPVLPQGEIWTWHFGAGLMLFFCSTAYALYMARSGLSRRVALKKLRVFQLPAAARVRWGAVNVALHWALYLLVVILTVSGIFLYLGHGGWLVTVHTVAAFGALGYIVAHVVAHYLYGGWGQLLRLFRPSRLVATRATRARPMLLGVALAVPLAFGLAWLDFGTRSVLTVAPVDEAPVLDGVLDDAAWADAPTVTIRTQQGLHLGGSGESTVEVKAVSDGERIHFAFRWQDPTRSLRRVPLIKRADGWHLLHERADVADETAFYEDKFSVVFSHSDAFGGGGATHLGEKPLADLPPALNQRGLHYTTDGSYVDMWQWKATRGGMIGVVDDQHIGPPRVADQAQIDFEKRYQAGYTGDPGTSFYKYNYVGEPPGGYRGPVEVLRLPRDAEAMMAAMNVRDDADLERFLDPASSDPEGTRTWMYESESVEFSPRADAAIPEGTVIPGVLILGEYTGDRADVAGGARWADGRWTLEASRVLDTASDYDVAFRPGEALYMWVAVFDHNQTRHSRHVRPVRVEMR